jgi:hypothetical protein
VTPEAAINFEPEYEDLLGFYEDGVKRTLTDEQIAVFRRTEEWQLEREAMRVAEEAAERAQTSGAAFESAREEQVPNPVEVCANGARSPISDVSSLEDELISHAARDKLQQPPRLAAPRAPSQSRRSGTPMSASGDGSNRRRSEEVPYDERRKRRWESYIQENDPVEGSMTHRRMARELDNQKHEDIEMDY